MTEAISAVLKFAFGFISNKLRSYSAGKLQDGDLADEKFRGWIVRELDDIKFKLDAISRKDLSMAISCLEQGIKRLILFAGESFKIGKSPLETHPNDHKQVLTETTEQLVTVENAVALASAIGKIKIESNERFLSAKQSFTKAGEKASEAFHNASLSLNDRILACKVRIASGILEKVDDLQLAANDCLHYLQDLHNMSAIKEMFSVHVHGGLKSLFKKDSRGEMVDTVTMINLLLADFITKYTKFRMGVLDWPLIECNKRVIHPIHYARESVQKMREIEITPPWNVTVNKEPIDELLLQSFAIDGKADIVRVFSGGYHPRKLDRATGEWKPLSLSPAGDSDCYGRSVAIDDDNNIYVLSCEHVHDAHNLEDNLSVYHSDGTIVYHRRPLNFAKEGAIAAITVTKDKKIVFCSFKGLGCRTGTLYICDASGELIVSFPIRLNSPFERVLGVFVSDDISADNEITVATGMKAEQVHLVQLYVYTQEGMLKRTATLCHASSKDYKVSFDNVTKNYIICSAAPFDEIVNVKYLSTDGELRNSLFLDRGYVVDYENVGFLISHADGAIALVNSYCVFHLQM